MDAPPGLAVPVRPWWHVLLPLAVVLAGLLAYSNASNGTFVFDDDMWVIRDRDSARRSLVNWTLDLNRNAAAWNAQRNEPEARGFLKFNIAVHLAAAAALYGVVRRTLLTAPLRERFGAYAPWFALAVALLWVVHPLTTQSVMYVIQRAQALAGMFYLLVFYGSIRLAEAQSRSPDSPGGWPIRPPLAHLWLALAVVASCLGMISKGDMVTAPVLVLLFDRVFLSASWREVFRRRWPLYVGLALSWLLLVQSGLVGGVLSTGKRSATVGFSYGGATPFEYLMTQAQVIPHYLKLAVWPQHLCLDYSWPFVRRVSEVYLEGMLLLVALAAAAVGVVRNKPLGFVAAAFFVLLAPTSSFIQIRDAAFEHRMYLALAPVLILVAGLVLVFGRELLKRRPMRVGAMIVAVVVATLLGARTRARTADYADDVRLWRSVIALAPDNPRAHYNLGKELGDLADRAAREGRRGDVAPLRQQAIESYLTALKLSEDHVSANNNIGMEYAKLGREPEAIPYFRRVVQLDRRHALSRSNLGLALSNEGQHEEGLPYIADAARLRPDNPEIWLNYGLVLMRLQRYEEAEEKFETVLKLKPNHVNAARNLELIRSRM